jgi:NAD(P)-dependent dehydrogenase (short-subunit alcohol dehydrogenase family)
MATTGGLVLVTGGLSGIGAAAASVLAEEGFRVLVADIATTAASRAPDGTTLWPSRFDVSDETAVEEGIGEIEAAHGPLVGLVNAAGILGKMHKPDRLKMVDWDREMAVDLRGTYLMCRAAGTRMVARGAGAIVNIASVVGSLAAPVHGYGPAKAAVINLTQTLAAEWGEAGVRVNAVSPGFTRTPALETAFKVGALSQQRLQDASALKRLVEPREVGRAVSWLIGPHSSAVTGINMPVDAGFLASIGWQPYGVVR